MPRFPCSLLAAAALVAGCSKSATPAARPDQPAQPVAQPPPPAPVTPDIQRLDAGAWPGSNTHRWGKRYYELRTNAGQLELRIHDAIDFQGVGMKPSDMSPTRHTCTTWEAAPAPIALATTPPAGTGTIACTSEQQLCAEILGYYKSSDRSRLPPPSDAHRPDVMHTFGRGGGGC